jgi:hypothetical protein
VESERIETDDLKSEEMGAEDIQSKAAEALRYFGGVRPEASEEHAETIYYKAVE